MASFPKQKWAALVSKTHQEQAIWFLNAFWNGGVKQHSEKIWEICNQVEKLGKGNDLDELKSHKFLEDAGETMTVLELRAKLAQIDLDKNKRMCISEYLLFKFSKQPKDLVDAPQGDPKELEAAQTLVDEASRALDEVLQQLEHQKEVASKLAKAEKDAEAAVHAAQDAVKAAEDAVNEQKAAAAELDAQEKAYKDKIAQLEKKSEEGGVVSRNKAKAELEQVKAEDPLPLRKAKLNQQAAVRKSEKAQKAAEDKAEAAAVARAQAEAARIEAERAAEKLEAASRDAEKKRDEALEFLDKVKASGAGAGQVWWMQREMYEKQKYLPKAKQTMAYPNPA
jgi:DNA repair exonuclease SbcCD ATPase subunit